MRLGIEFGRAASGWLTGAALTMSVAVGARALGAQQERPTQRVANIVSVAVEEYGKGVDEKGRLTSRDEYV